jgi:dihydrofolate synthase/folylpolyglutamate synthase
MGFFARTHAVLGAMHDKDVEGMVRPLLPLVSHWYLTDLPLARAATAAELRERLARAADGDRLALSEHRSPSAALAAALGAADPADRILLFGSFYTVGGVLKDGLRRLEAAPPG